MPFDRPARPASSARRIAVIGAGISGMGAAHALALDHRVTLIESRRRLGGHARTRMAGPDADASVDTGFIVFNHANYPNLVALFTELGVETRPSQMSFSASIDGGRLEYALHSLSALFAQRRNLLRPSFLRMVRDILRFNKHGLALAEARPDLTVGGLIDELGLSAAFRDHYLTPFSGAIWSTPKEKILSFPALALLRFFENHALLGAYGQHQWHTVAGGSAAYVSRLEAALTRRGVELRASAPARAVRRVPGGVEVRQEGGEFELFDEVVLACHSDDALALLSDATDDERANLGAIRYQPNAVVLHSDTSVMPQRRKVWAAWNYTETHDGPRDEIDLTYWMNALQPWLTGRDYMVTLNTTRPIREDLIWDCTELRHPVYDTGAFAAQARVARTNGARGTWFCGAWMKNGFHEDGLASAYDVVTGINAARTRVAAE